MCIRDRVLGDQKSGINVESPLSTMKQAFLEALEAHGYTGGSPGPDVVELSIDGAKFARLMNPYNQRETTRRGINLIMER